MKYMQAAVLCFLFFLSGENHAFAAGAFGIELGSDIEQYSHEKQPASERQELRMFELTPPAADPRFDTYAVDTFRGRIIRIMASSPDDASADASATLEVFHSLKSELREHYGEPALSMDEVEDAGDDLRGYLTDEGGIEVLEWNFPDRKADEPGAVYVFLAGAENGDGTQASYCTLYMESPEYPVISEQLRQMEGNAEGLD